MGMATNEHQNMDERVLSEELTKMTKEKNELYDELNKVALEGQKWRDRCVGLEVSKVELTKKCDNLTARCLDLKRTYEKYDCEIKEIRQETEKLVKENENLDTLILSFRLVLQETYRKIKPLKCERNTK